MQDIPETDKIYSQIKDLIAPYNRKNIPITPDTTFSGDLDLDSLTVMDVVAVIEDEYDIVLPLNMLPDLENVQQVADAVTEILKSK